MILVFRKGSSHTFHGVDCELKRITMVDLRAHEQEGWVLDHRELAETPETSETPETGEAQDVNPVVLDPKQPMYPKRGRPPKTKGLNNVA